ncbi:hypothetical protein CBR_g26270 [Chara braunii]|uniref:Ribosome assembly factor mrt4 n=1 Tax=Chara braunii TaxID=69332 RepID=A0A388L7G1_CHABU|nr:hypothetical protein CBR_g26270 [Chara braunii]|eukprot:GBG78236.1 hypothetical protein CBR_g26270 [Chara braunii]
MPKSKRNKLVSLTVTKKRGKERKETMVGNVRECFDKYESLYVIGWKNMRNTKMKELRDQFSSTSRFFLGSNKVLQIALGRSQADEEREGLHKVSEVSGPSGLCSFFSEFEVYDFARLGNIATETVELEEGPLHQFPHDIEPFLRKQGMPTRLNRGVVELVAKHTVCKEGRPLTPEASRILRLLGVKMAPFHIHLVARWVPETELEIFPEAMAQAG